MEAFNQHSLSLFLLSEFVGKVGVGENYHWKEH